MGRVIAVPEMYFPYPLGVARYVTLEDNPKWYDIIAKPAFFSQ
jgi:hypothetical protein